MPSPDRIDSNIGYTPTNCQMVCWIYNQAKNNFGDETLYELCRAVVGRTRQSRLTQVAHFKVTVGQCQFCHGSGDLQKNARLRFGASWITSRRRRGKYKNRNAKQSSEARLKHCPKESRTKNSRQNGINMFYYTASHHFAFHALQVAVVVQQIFVDMSTRTVYSG
jgi:hypothetical protein